MKNQHIKKITCNPRPLPSLLAALALVGGFVATGAIALPADDSGMTVDAGTASYSFDGLSEQGTLLFGENNSMVSFGGSPVDIGANQALVVMPDTGGSASWVGVIRDLSGSASNLDGTLATGMQVFFLNPNGILTGNNFTVDMTSLGSTGGSLLLSTHSIDASLLSQGQYRFDSAVDGQAVTVNGLQVLGQNGKVLLLADQVNIDGAIDVGSGRLEAVSAGSTELLFGIDEMLAIRAPLSVAGISHGVNVGNAASVEGQALRLAASVDDPLSLALNNRGMLRATGVSVNKRGEIILQAGGGVALNTGELDTRDAVHGDGDIELAGNTVALGGNVQAGQGQVNVAVGNASTGANGELRLLDNSTFSAAAATVTGLGQVNTINGLANYIVSGSNSGSAGWRGVGGAGWQNTGAATFSGVSRLIAQVGVEHLLKVEAAGSLGNAAGSALLRGGARSDRFEIAGAVQRLEGIGGNDTFVMQGGLVTGLVDGGGGIDRIENVFNVVRSGPQGINGTSDFVDWVNIQSVLELPVPPPTSLPDLSALQASQSSFVNVSTIAAAVLGAVGGSAEPSLPCGFGSGGVTATVNSAEEEPCFDEQQLKQFQHLVSSLVYFDHDSVAIKQQYAEQLDAVIRFFRDSGRFARVQIAAHTNDIGTESYNLALSERRARSAADYMRARGIRDDLIETFHFGEALPAVPNDSDENRALNRRARIELKP